MPETTCPGRSVAVRVSSSPSDASSSTDGARERALASARDAADPARDEREALKQQEAEVKAKNLQTTGHVSRATVMAFFDKNDEVLASEEVS